MSGGAGTQKDVPGGRNASGISRSRPNRRSLYPFSAPSMYCLYSISQRYNFYLARSPVQFLVSLRRRFRYVLAIYPWYRTRISNGGSPDRPTLSTYFAVARKWPPTFRQENQPDKA